MKFDYVLYENKKIGTIKLGMDSLGVYTFYKVIHDQFDVNTLVFKSIDGRIIYPGAYVTSDFLFSIVDKIIYLVPIDRCFIDFSVSDKMWLDKAETFCILKVPRDMYINRIVFNY